VRWIPRGRAEEPRKTFLLGAGCQKGGTTWLYEYLRASPQFAHGFRKEYHVLSSLEGTGQWMLGVLRERGHTAVDAVTTRQPAEADVLHRLAMVADPDRYYDYFADLFRRDPGHRLAADLTPEYGRLPAERYRSAVAEFDARGIRTVASLVMRDPVDRIWSQMRMQHGRVKDRFDQPLLEALRDRHLEAVYFRRTQYQETFARLDEVFAPADLHYAFYEELFTEAETTRLCRIVGIDPHPGDFGQRVNTWGSKEPLPRDLERLVAQSYAEVYAAVAERFGRDRVLAVWPRAALVL
jgi:hypothetical protein